MATGRGTGLDTTFTAYDVPISAVLKWPPGNFTNPQKRHWFVPYGAVLHVITSLVMGMRLWTRLSKRPGSWGPDDILIIIAYLMSTAVYGLGVYGVMNGGLDRHVWDLRPAMAAKAGFFGWIIEIIFLSALCLVKISVLVFFRRLMDRTHSKHLLLAISSGIFIISAYWIGFGAFLVFACKPIDSAWKSLDITWQGKYKCLSRDHVDVVNGFISVFTDAYAIVIPVIIVRNLSMATPQKIVLYIVFCCGLIVVGAGSVRTYFLSRMFTDPRRDLTWNGHDLLIWGYLEMEMALICASAPAMKGFFLKVGEKVAHRYGTRGGSSGSRSRNMYGGRSYPTKNSSGDPDSALTSDQYDLTRLTPNSGSSWPDKLEKQLGAMADGGASRKASNPWSEPPTTTLEYIDGEKAGKSWLNTSDTVHPHDRSPIHTTRSSPLVHPRRAGPRQDAADPAALRRQNSRAAHQQQQHQQQQQQQPDRDNKSRYPKPDYVQLDGSGIRVEQRWSVASLGPEHTDTQEEVAMRNARDAALARSREAKEAGARRKF